VVAVVGLDEVVVVGSLLYVWMCFEVVVGVVFCEEVEVVVGANWYGKFVVSGNGGCVVIGDCVVF